MTTEATTRAVSGADGLAWLDATAQAELVRTRALAPVELVEAAIARIERLNPQLNAVITPLFHKAVAAVTARDAPDGPFGGVPLLLKDVLAASAGDPLHAGMRVLKQLGWTEPEDSHLVQRFRAAGFVLCGKTNVPELATMATTEPLAHGATRNPWSLERSPGGSSGGAAAAVAAGMVPVAHASDMGGSIRVPASACGLVGLKPTRARTTLGPAFGEYWGPVTHEHVLTRSVRDSAAVLDAIAGIAPGDPYTAPPPARPYRHELNADPGRLRIGFRSARREGAGNAHPDCVAAVIETARLLDSLAHHVQPATVAALDDPAMTDALPTLFSAVIARDLDRWSARVGRPIQPAELEPMNARLAELGRAISATQWLAAIEVWQSWARRIAAWWAEGFDVLLTPTLPAPPPLLGELAPAAGEPADLLARQTALMTFTLPFNVTGQPAISLPLHWNADGLPIGIQLVAAHGREDLLIRLAAQLEQARPWAHRHPPHGAPPDPVAHDPRKETPQP